jgi:outer membrane protein OmpU
MNNLRKIGLTALAGSLVASTVAVAGDLAVTGAAEIAVKNHSQDSNGKSVSMVNSVNFAGSGETDGGLTVNLSFELDQGSANGTGPFDNHKVSIGTDTIGTLTVHGHGGSNSAAAIDATAAGDLWDNTMGISTGTGGNSPKSGAGGNNLVVYTLPALADGVAISGSYSSDGANNEGSGALGVTYTGIDGLTVNLGTAEDNSTVAVSADYTTMSVEYVFEAMPITVGISSSEYDHTTATNDQEVKSWGVTYTVTEDISISYGQEKIENNLDTADVETDGVTASYTSGGMTVTAKSIGADNVDGSSTGVNNNNEYWKLAASFAF